jgi:hypothetical protein
MIITARNRLGFWTVSAALAVAHTHLMPDRRPSPRQRRTPDTVAAELDAAERIHLFCLASGTSLAKTTGNTAAIRGRLVIRGLIERDGSSFVVTEQGREVLAALLADTTRADDPLPLVGCSPQRFASTGPGGTRRSPRP